VDSRTQVRSFDLVIDKEDVSDVQIKGLAHRSLTQILKLTQFKIVSIELVEEGEIETGKGMVTGKRFVVEYENQLPN